MQSVLTSKLTEEERRQLARESKRALFVGHAWRTLAAAQDAWRVTSDVLTRPPRVTA
jgi:hypothetical protein